MKVALATADTRSPLVLLIHLDIVSRRPHTPPLIVNPLRQRWPRDFSFGVILLNKGEPCIRQRADWTWKGLWRSGRIDWFQQYVKSAQG
jgi:hypothetical protein